MFQHCLNFNTNNEVGIFVTNIYLFHGILNFKGKSITNDVYKLEVALVNKQTSILYKIVEPNKKENNNDMIGYQIQ